MNIKIVNIKHTKNYIDCSRNSFLGNPYFMKNESERNLVCDKYKEYFYSVINTPKGANMLKEIHNIVNVLDKNKYVNLGCYCAPKRCHCETIKEYILNNFEIKGNVYDLF